MTSADFLAVHEKGAKKLVPQRIRTAPDTTSLQNGSARSTDEAAHELVGETAYAGVCPVGAFSRDSSCHNLTVAFVFTGKKT